MKGDEKVKGSLKIMLNLEKYVGTVSKLLYCQFDAFTVNFHQIMSSPEHFAVTDLRMLSGNKHLLTVSCKQEGKAFLRSP